MKTLSPKSSKTSTPRTSKLLKSSSPRGSKLPGSPRGSKIPESPRGSKQPGRSSPRGSKNVGLENKIPGSSSPRGSKARGSPRTSRVSSRAQNSPRGSKMRKKSSVSKTASKRVSRKSKSSQASMEENILEDGSKDSKQSSFSKQSETRRKINYQEEVINEFYTAMLDEVVEEWKEYEDEGRDGRRYLSIMRELEEQESEDNIDGERLTKVESKDFKNMTEQDLLNGQIVSVKGSQVSYLKTKLPSFGAMRKSSTDKSASISSDLPFSQYDYGCKYQSVGLIETERDMAAREAFFQGLIDNMENLSGILHEEPSMREDVVTIIFKSGAIYKGPVEDSCMHGRGKFYWPDGSYYEGDFKKGEITGQGFLILPDLSYYMGDFCGGWFHGQGTMFISGTSMIYSGMWKAGMKHGKGWLLYKEGNWYDGDWKNDMKHGVGLRQYDYGVRYKGNWENGKRSGKGTMLFQNNDFYEGDWVDGLPSGYGEYTWNVVYNDTLCFPVVNQYKGNWKKGFREGAGIMDFGISSGATLAGIWHKNLKHGPGVMLCGNGKIIQKKPLFLFDKPLHLGFDYSNLSIAVSEDLEKENKPMRVSSVLGEDLKSFKQKDSFKKSIQQITEVWQSSGTLASEGVFNEILQAMNLNDRNQNEIVNINYDEFPNPPVQCNPIDIPMHAVPESLDLSFIITMATVTCKGHCDRERYRKDSIPDVYIPAEKFLYGSKPKVICGCDWDTCEEMIHLTQLCKYQNESDFFTTEDGYVQFEESKLRTCIKMNFSNILLIYDYYTKLTVPEKKEIKFKPVMVRLFLWQMFRDFGLVDMGYSLFELDEVCAKNTESGFETDHAPFEKIYLWQFINVLLSVSYYSCTYFQKVDTLKGEGLLSLIFKDFLTNICLPNVGKRKEQFLRFGDGPPAGKCLFEYKDLLPINSVYCLYRTYGEPHTAREFLKNACVKKGETVPCYFKSYPDEGLANIKNGVNVAAYGTETIFLADDEPAFSIREQPDPPVDPFYKYLYVFRDLGPKRIVQVIKSICPPIAEEDVIVNMDYSLVFIEFYDIILALAFAMVDRAKKKEAREKRWEEIKELVAQGLWPPPAEKKKKESEKGSTGKLKKEKHKKKGKGKKGKGKKSKA